MERGHLPLTTSSAGLHARAFPSQIVTAKFEEVLIYFPIHVT